MSVHGDERLKSADQCLSMPYWERNSAIELKFTFKHHLGSPKDNVASASIYNDEQAASSSKWGVFCHQCKNEATMHEGFSSGGGDVPHPSITDIVSCEVG